MSEPVLKGVKVVDLSHVIAGPMASHYLAAMGADVIKVENPCAPDVMRYVDTSVFDDVSIPFAAMNGGKRSLAIDLKQPRLRAVLLDMLRDADVFIENFRPGTAERLGFSYEAVRAVNPSIIYLSISGYGREGRWREYGAYDQVVQALVGMMMVNGDEGGPPSKVGFPVIDAATGIFGAMAVVGALHGRREGQPGRQVSVSMAQSGLQLMLPIVARVLNGNGDIRRSGNQGYSGSPGARTFPCADGWLSVAANTMAQFRRFCEAIGCPEVPNDTDLVRQGGQGGSTTVIAVDPAVLAERLDVATGGRNAGDLETVLNEAGVPAARVRSLSGFLHELEADGIVDGAIHRRPHRGAELADIGLGIDGLGGDGPGAPPPNLGADTLEILRSLGMSDAEIADLVDDRAVHLDEDSLRQLRGRANESA